MGCLGNKDSQGTLAGINNSYENTGLVTQLAKGIGGTHILIPYLPDISAIQDTPGDIGSGDRAEDITQNYY